MTFVIIPLYIRIPLYMVGLKNQLHQVVHHSGSCPRVVNFYFVPLSLKKRRSKSPVQARVTHNLDVCKSKDHYFESHQLDTVFQLYTSKYYSRILFIKSFLYLQNFKNLIPRSHINISENITHSKVMKYFFYLLL